MSEAKFGKKLRIGVSVSASSIVFAAMASAVLAASVVDKLDKDHDDTLDRSEVREAAGARFGALDQNQNAMLDPGEAQSVLGMSAFKAADSDDDGTLSKAEYLALVDQLFDQADADHDGTLDRRELNSKPGHRLVRLIR